MPPLVLRVKPSLRGRPLTSTTTPPLAALPPPLPPTIDDVVDDFPAHQQRASLRSSLRIQAAALFALLAIIVSGLLVTIAFAYQASDQTHVEQDALYTWRYSTARIDTTAGSVITEVYLWNNAKLGGDLLGAQQIQSQIAADGTVSYR